MSHAVIIKNAVKKYGDFTALNGVSLDIKQGEFFTLLGVDRHWLRCVAWKNLLICPPRALLPRLFPIL